MASIDTDTNNPKDVSKWEFKDQVMFGLLVFVVLASIAIVIGVWLTYGKEEGNSGGGGGGSVGGLPYQYDKDTSTLYSNIDSGDSDNVLIQSAGTGSGSGSIVISNIPKDSSNQTTITVIGRHQTLATTQTYVLNLTHSDAGIIGLVDVLTDGDIVPLPPVPTVSVVDRRLVVAVTGPSIDWAVESTTRSSK